MITCGNKLDIELDADIKGCFIAKCLALRKIFFGNVAACVIRLGGEISIIDGKL